MYFKSTRFKINRLLAGLPFCLMLGFSSAISAALIDNGNGLIYDTELNITWSRDANLLGTLELNNPNVVSRILSANNNVIYDLPNAYDNNSGVYGLSMFKDFFPGGRVDWFGAQAFVGYLNSIDYKGSNQWCLPSTPVAAQMQGYYLTGSDMGQLFYNELGGAGGNSITAYHNSNYTLFSNIQNDGYWSEKEYETNPVLAWMFDASAGSHASLYKGSPYYTWVVAPGNVGAVPIPGAMWLFGSCLACFIGFNRRKSTFLL